MELVQKLNQDKEEATGVDAHMEQKQDTDANATKRTAPPSEERPAKELKKDEDAF